MNRLNKRQTAAVPHMKRRELMVLSSMVQGLKILKATGLPTKEHRTKQKPPSRITYGGQSCMQRRRAVLRPRPLISPQK